jgi:mono/diheme cytochrome c family protein
MKKLIAPLALVAVVLAACPKKEEATPSTAAPTSPPAAQAPTAPAPTDAAAAGTATAPAATGAVAAAADPAAEAENVFNTRCAVCHGMTGKGDGIGAAALNPKPRDYSDPTWQASVTDDSIAKVIVEGGPAVGKSPLMAANLDLKDKPEVVKALVAKVRSFKK